LLGISRSSYYYQPAPENAKNLALMRRIDEIYTELPYYGALKITAQLCRELPEKVNCKRIARLMRLMGIQAIFPKKNTSQPHPEHEHYPYLLNGLGINHPNQVWGTDITFVRARNLWFYLVAIIDWYSRYVLAWKLSRTLETGFCATALEQALSLAIPEIHNSDQGSQFTSEEYLAIIKQYPQIRISMDSRGRCFDNIFTERLWRSVKYEEVYLRDYETFDDARQSLGRYFKTYNEIRLHQSLGYRTPAEVYFQIPVNSQISQEILKVENHLKIA
jgi:putative transposase